MTRVKTFFHFLSASPAIADNNLEPQFYLTQCLFNFWSALRPGRPEARDIFTDRNHVCVCGCAGACVCVGVSVCVRRMEVRDNSTSQFISVSSSL